jgi:hypothetical protein
MTEFIYFARIFFISILQRKYLERMEVENALFGDITIKNILSNSKKVFLTILEEIIFSSLAIVPILIFNFLVQPKKLKF